MTLNNMQAQGSDEEETQAAFVETANHFLCHLVETADQFTWGRSADSRADLAAANGMALYTDTM